jgi:uncharacterized protein YjaG (DUF416 family)
MLRFDASALVSSLKCLTLQGQVAFAAAAATRQLPNYEIFVRSENIGAEPSARMLLSKLWEDLHQNIVDRELWSGNLELVMERLPGEGQGWDIPRALADDALASLAYAIRCLLSEDPQEAVWAASRAYESADQRAICGLEIQPGPPDAELKIKSHPFVQHELGYQLQDLADLQMGLQSAVEMRARHLAAAGS